MNQAPFQLPLFPRFNVVANPIGREEAKNNRQERVNGAPQLFRKLRQKIEQHCLDDQDNSSPKFRLLEQVAPIHNFTPFRFY